MNLEGKACKANTQQEVDRNISYSLIKITKVNKRHNRRLESIPDKVFLVPSKS
jgi:hypothetical protein